MDEMAARLKASLEERQSEQQRKQELIAGMSHDLKSPLTSIRARMEVRGLFRSWDIPAMSSCFRCCSDCRSSRDAFSRAAISSTASQAALKMCIRDSVEDCRSPPPGGVSRNTKATSSLSLPPDRPRPGA